MGERGARKAKKTELEQPIERETHTHTSTQKREKRNEEPGRSKKECAHESERDGTMGSERNKELEQVESERATDASK